MSTKQPSIAYLELYALTTGILIWSELLKNCRIVVNCDNQSVVDMVNSTSSNCKNCMYLIRLLALSGLVNNRRVFAKHVRTGNNGLADSLSRLDFDRFYCLAGDGIDPEPESLPEVIWPLSKIWLD